MKVLIALGLVFSLLTATFAAAAAGPDLGSATGCASVEAGEFCIDPQMLPAKGGTAEKSSKCLGPFMASTGPSLFQAGDHVRTGFVADGGDGHLPRNPKRPPRA